MTGVSTGSPTRRTRPVSARLVPVRARSAIVLAVVFAVGIVAFGWPFVIDPGAALDTSHSGDAPFVFVVLLPLLAAVVLSELTSGAMDAKAVAMLGMLAAVGGALRALGPGTAGLEPSFAVIILGGRAPAAGSRRRTRPSRPPPSGTAARGRHRR